MTRIDEAAEVYRAQPPRRQCQHGCRDHDSLLYIDVDVSGPCDAVPDYPTIPDGLGVKFEMAVFNPDHFDFQREGYCPAVDEVALSVLAQGRWEGWYTALMLDILALGPAGSTVIDFGASVGWYTLTAAAAGHQVLAVEGDADIAKLLAASVAHNEFEDRVVVAEGWIDAHTQPVPSVPVRFVKIDVEGEELVVLATLFDLIGRKSIDFLLVEVSPEFTGWANADLLMGTMASAGYEARFAPDKEWAAEGWMPAFEAAPLYSTLAQPVVPEHHFRDHPVQRNILFSRFS